MGQVSCEHCGKSIKFDNKHAGKTANCPQCEKPIILPSEPAAQVARKEPTPLPPSRPRHGIVGRSMIVCALIVGAVCVLVWCFEMNGSTSYRPGAGSFQADNAVGATANAVEDLARQSRDADPAMLLLTIAGLLCLVVIVLERIRAELAAIRQRQDLIR